MTSPELERQNPSQLLRRSASAALFGRAGYFLVRRPPGQTLDDARDLFFQLMDSFGENVSRDPTGNPVRAAAIRSHPDPTFSGAYIGDAHSDNEIPLHADGSGDTDRVVRILGMYCERQAPRGGETILCDPFAVLASFTAAELEALREPWPRKSPHHRPGQSAYVERPILGESADGPCFSYGYQRLLLGLEAIPDGEDRARRRALLESLDSRLRDNATELRLAEGDSILVNNLRMLHGRRRFVDSGDAARSLLRVWIGEWVLSASPC